MKAGGKYGALRILQLILALALTAPAAAEPVEELDVGGGLFALEWRGEFSAAGRRKLKSWLQSVAETMKKLHGTLPRSRTRIILEQFTSERYRSVSPVPFARVLRSGDQGILFYVNPAYPLDDFVSDWTAYHEFSHLFIPFPGRADIWFSEGLASYYQNVLQYRSGLLTEEQAWQKLYDGFERGRVDNRYPEYTLADLCSNLRETHAFMRVYWTGALYFLEADLKLRSRSENRMTLDYVLQTFGHCCLNEHKRWNGLNIAAEFDRIAGAELFVPLYAQYENLTAIPDFVPVLNAAGVKISAGRVESDSRTLLNVMPLRTE
ncbi:MAG: hypothetical protein QF790_07065 [Gammaproteobacteria bacterium]|nr:hypothetical protein [Gammaproteobacteria bacterium]MDP6694948.1 hypothetical protein [Gammaproteobacteria bacterium]